MIPYIGGKSVLSKWIIENFPQDYQKMSYVEVFGGGGWVLNKKERSYLETYNDLNSDLVNLFKIIRDNYEAFKHRCEWTLHSREMFQEAREKLKDDEFMSDIEKALYYAITKSQSFSAIGTSFAYKLTADKVFNGKWTPFIRRLEYINQRMKAVQIECLDFEKLIEKYDSENTLFYVDPPYVDCEFYYKASDVNFTKDDHIRLAGLLKNIKGKFVLSYYEHEFVRELYSDYKTIHKLVPKSSYASSRHHEKTKPIGKELLIMNY